MNSIANYISISRILLALMLFTVKPLSFTFFIIYVVCGFSDVFDGYIARKTDTVSKLGEKLDSLADLVMVAILAILLYPIINPPIIVSLWIAFIVIIRIISISIVYVKYTTFHILHSYGNKATGVVLFTLPLLLKFTQPNILMYVICAVASISAIEEIYIHISTNELQTNRKSILEK